jgi:hypothetical protein
LDYKAYFIAIMMPTTPKAEYEESGVGSTKTNQEPTTPKPFDVLCGTGIETANQPGNELFAGCVLKYVEPYAHAESKKEKMQISKAAMDELVQSGVRFLKKHPVYQHWYVADEKVGRDRIGHFLRHHAGPKRQKLGSTSRDKGIIELPALPDIDPYSKALFAKKKIVSHQHQLHPKAADAESTTKEMRLFDEEPDLSCSIVDAARTAAINYWAAQTTQSPATLVSLSIHQPNHRSVHNNNPCPSPIMPSHGSESKEWSLSAISHHLDSSPGVTKSFSRRDTTRGDSSTRKAPVDNSPRFSVPLDHSNHLFDDDELADRLDWEVNHNN